MPIHGLQQQTKPPVHSTPAIGLSLITITDFHGIIRYPPSALTLHALNELQGVNRRGDIVGANNPRAIEHGEHTGC